MTILLPHHWLTFDYEKGQLYSQETCNLEAPMSILKRLQLSFIGLGLLMGLCFPVYAQFFVDYKDGMFSGFFVGCLIAGAFIGVVNFWLLNRLLIPHLKQVADVSQAIVNKDLSRRCQLKSNDVIGHIIQNVNVMASNLQNSISDIQTVSKSCYVTIDQLQQQADNSISKTRQQNAATDHALQAVQTLNDHAANIKQQTQQAAESSLATKQQAQSSVQGMLSAMNSMNLLSEQSQQASQTINDLKQHSQHIGGVLSTIADISEQTNLLALNAAIEAARAGEQGRGFAVVADEVRALANRTQQATSEIQSMISQLQNGTEQAVGIINKGQSLSKDGMSHMQSTQQSLDAILTAVSDIEVVNNSIQMAVTQQGGAIDDTNDNVQTLMKIALSSSALSAQTNTVCKNLHQQISGLHDSVKTYRI